MRSLTKLIASVCFIGYLPLIPGTFASIAGALFFLFFNGNPVIYLSALFTSVLLGFIFSGKAEKLYQEKDPGKVVIDELSGMLLSYLLIPFSVKNLILGFALFRIFDITKPFPCRRLEKLEGSAGIMLDDLIAAVYSNIILHIFNILPFWK